MPLLTPRECRQRLTVARQVGVDAFGEAEYGNDVAYAVRLVARRRLVRNPQGEQVVSTHTAYFLTAPTVDVHDRVTLSTGDVHSTETTVRRPAILDVGHYPDDRGRAYTILYLA